jgi:hypothetical protein
MIRSVTPSVAWGPGCALTHRPHPYQLNSDCCLRIREVNEGAREWVRPAGRGPVVVIWCCQFPARIPAAAFGFLAAAMILSDHVRLVSQAVGALWPIPVGTRSVPPRPSSMGGLTRPSPGGNHDEPLLGHSHPLHGSCSAPGVWRFLAASPTSLLIMRPLHWLCDPRQGGHSGSEGHR